MKNHTYIGTSQFYKRALSIAIPVMAQLLIQNFVSFYFLHHQTGKADFFHGSSINDLETA